MVGEEGDPGSRSLAVGAVHGAGDVERLTRLARLDHHRRPARGVVRVSTLGDVEEQQARAEVEDGEGDDQRCPAQRHESSLTARAGGRLESYRMYAASVAGLVNKV